MNPNATSAIGIAGNSPERSMDMTVTFTADNDAGTAAVSTVPLIRGTGKGSASGLPAGVTISAGDFSSYEEMQSAFVNTGINITAIVIESDDTTHFTGNKNITITERQFNGRPTDTQKILLSQHKTSDGSGVSTTLEVPVAQGGLFVTPRTVMNLELNKNKSLTVTIYYNYEEKMRLIAKTA